MMFQSRNILRLHICDSYDHATHYCPFHFFPATPFVGQNYDCKHGELNLVFVDHQQRPSSRQLYHEQKPALQHITCYFSYVCVRVYVLQFSVGNKITITLTINTNTTTHTTVITTVYPKKYAHGFCFAVLCCGYTLTDFPISIRLTSLALWQSNDCPSASKATLMNMDKYYMWIHYERLHNHNKAKHNKTVCIFLGIYCITTV